MVELIHNTLPYGVLGLQILAGLLLLCLIFAKENQLAKWVGKNAVQLGFLVTLGAVLGSLFYSNVMAYEPCYLCWWQRIFIYPQFFIFAMALWKKRTDVWLYAVPLSIIGLLISLYHNLLPYLESAGIDCGSTGAACGKLFVFAFGYLTIPVMSLTVFVTILLLALSNKNSHEE